MRLYQQPDKWKQIITNGMRRDVGWGPSARAYLNLYAA